MIDSRSCCHQPIPYECKDGFLYISLQLEYAKMIYDGFLKKRLIKCFDNQSFTRWSCNLGHQEKKSVCFIISTWSRVFTQLISILAAPLENRQQGATIVYNGTSAGSTSGSARCCSPAQIRFLLISAPPAGRWGLENLLLRSNMTILKLSGVIPPNLLRGGS